MFGRWFGGWFGRWFGLAGYVVVVPSDRIIYLDAEVRRALVSDAGVRMAFAGAEVRVAVAPPEIRRLLVSDVGVRTALVEAEVRHGAT